MKKARKILLLIMIVLFLVSGTMVISYAKGNRDWKWPVPASNSLSSCYLDGRAHYALDIPASQGASVYASYPGTVIATYTGCSHNYAKNSSCGCGGGLGNYVYIKHSYQGTNYVSRYGHLTSVKVSVGNSVTKNTIIGTVGTTGYSTGNHLDFRIYKGSSTSHNASTSAIDPFKEEFLEMPSGFRSTAGTSCCYTYVDEVKAIYSKPTDTQKPVISNVKIVDNNATGYTVTCTVTDNVGVTRVAFLSWTHFNGQDDLFWRDGTKSGNTYSFRVNKSEHNGESEWYSTHIYAYDAAGNTATFGTDVLVPPDGKIAETTYNGNRYAVYKGKVSYQYAKDLCESYGGHLARITSAGENNVVKGLVAKVGTCWIDGSDAQNEGAWKFSNGEKMSYFNWAKGEPNNDGNQDYLRIYDSGEWDDSFESPKTMDMMGFVCEFEHTHSYSSKITKQPTCTSTGVKTFTCSCGKSYTESIAKTSHNSNTTIPAVAPTCRETGLTEGKKCSACGTITVAQKVIDKVDCVNNDGDDMCDFCERDMPTNESSETDCSCSCHKGGISGLLFKIILFFQKIFGLNKECACGIAHY